MNEHTHNSTEQAHQPDPWLEGMKDWSAEDPQHPNRSVVARGVVAVFKALGAIVKGLLVSTFALASMAGSQRNDDPQEIEQERRKNDPFTTENLLDPRWHD